MKGRIIIISMTIIILGIGTIVGIVIYTNYQAKINEQNKIAEQQRYNEILDNMSKALDKYTEMTFPIHNDYNCSNYIKGHHTSDELIKDGYLNKKDMIDIDKKSYCKGVATSYLDDNCIMQFDVDIKCQNYKTDNFDNQLYNDFNEWKNFYFN